VTSVLVPWNTCGAYISGVLGVPTASYLPYCFFNILSPVLDVLFGFIGFKVPSAAPDQEAAAGPEPEPAPDGTPRQTPTEA
jgi:NhaC family Na+:H+ antiporter